MLYRFSVQPRVPKRRRSFNGGVWYSKRTVTRGQVVQNGCGTQTVFETRGRRGEGEGTYRIVDDEAHQQWGYDATGGCGRVGDAHQQPRIVGRQVYVIDIESGVRAAPDGHDGHVKRYGRDYRVVVHAPEPEQAGRGAPHGYRIPQLPGRGQGGHAPFV